MPEIIHFLITNTFKGLMRAGALINYSFANHKFAFVSIHSNFENLHI